MNAALNQINGALSSFQNMAQYSTNVNNMSSLSLNAYATGLNNVAALNAMSMVNGSGISNLSNLQTLTGQGVTGFTPTYEGERTLTQNGLHTLGGPSAADVMWPNNFVGIMADGTPYQQSVNITSNGNTAALNQASFGLNMSFPAMPKTVMQPVAPNNSTSPTNVLSTLSSLPGQPNIFPVQNQLGNNLQGLQFQRQEQQIAMKMMGPNILALRGTHVAHGN